MGDNISCTGFSVRLNSILFSSLEMVISRKLILFWNSSSIVKWIVVVGLYISCSCIFVYCFGKLRECHQRTENVLLKYRISSYLQDILDKFQKRLMMLERPYLGHLLVYVVNPFIENESLLKLYRTSLFRILILCLEHFGCTFTQWLQVNL